MSDYCDYMLMPLKDKISKATKEYKCCECGSIIPKGMKYWLFQGKNENEGGIETYHQHVECRDACHLISKKDDCIGFGELREHLSNYDDEVDYIREAHKLMFAGIEASKIRPEDLKYYNAKWDGRLD